MKFDLVSPERKLLSTDATAVSVPGIEGDMTILPGHAPFLTALRPGVVRVTAAAGTTEYVVTGGFVEVSPDAVSLLAELAVERAALTPALIEAQLAAAQALVERSTGPAKAAAQLRVNDLRALA